MGVQHEVCFMGLQHEVCFMGEQHEAYFMGVQLVTRSIVTELQQFLLDELLWF